MTPIERLVEAQMLAREYRKAEEFDAIEILEAMIRILLDE